MTLPEMIIFDYGHTLIHEPGFDTLRGTRELFKYVVRNKNGLTPEYVNSFSDSLFDELAGARGAGLELHQHQFQRLLYEYLDIELDLTPLETERVFWDGASRGAIMPGVDRLLGYIASRGIRSGVISNICFSGAALAARINRLLPGNRFEFIMASSEYILRKPDPRLFGVALRKAGLEPEKVWYCGDNASADVAGAASAGIFPVWYDNREIHNPWLCPDCPAPGADFLRVEEWDDLIKVLEGLK